MTDEQDAPRSISEAIRRRQTKRGKKQAKETSRFTSASGASMQFVVRGQQFAQGPLSEKHIDILDRLANAYDAVSMRHARTYRSLSADETLKAEHADFARAAVAAEAGLLSLAVCAEQPAVVAARQWLPLLRHQRSKVRKIKPIEARDPLDRLWLKFHKWLTDEVRRLHSQGLTYEAVQGAVVRGLRKLPDAGAEELATGIGRLGKSAWHDRARSLLQQDDQE